MESEQWLHLCILRPKGRNWSKPLLYERPLSADPVEKFGFSVRQNSGATATGELTHYIEWFLGSSSTFTALLLG